MTAPAEDNELRLRLAREHVCLREFLLLCVAERVEVGDELGAEAAAGVQASEALAAEGVLAHGRSD